MAETMQLSHVNTPPAQTWNYLRVNDISLEVPVPTDHGAAFNRLPRVFDGIECGLGDEAVDWIVSSVPEARYIEVPAHTRRDDPIVVVATAGENAYSDTGVCIREGAEATVVVAASADPSGDAITAALTRIIVERGATAHIVEVVAHGGANRHLEGLGIDAAKDARVDVRQYFLGGSNVAAGMACNLAGDDAAFELSCRYLVGNGELLDINHIVRARGRNTREDMVVSGMLADGSSKTLRETIDLIHGAKGSQGNEAETVLIAGEHIRNKTLPTILCDEDDVAGNHGATIGAISPEQLAYMSGRGLTEAEAIALFMRSIFDDALIHAPEPISTAAIALRAEAVLGNEISNDSLEALDVDLFKEV